MTKMFKPGDRVFWMSADDWDVDPYGTVIRVDKEYQTATVKWDSDGSETEESFGIDIVRVY